MNSQLEEEILRALRRITRAIDLHSRQLANLYGLTGPQLVCLRAIGHHGSLTPSKLAKEVSLSQPTVTGIIDRLVARQLIQRDRSQSDRRVVTVTLTDAGRALIQMAPSPLQEKFAKRLAALNRDEQDEILHTLHKIVSMMDGEELSAAPILAITPDPEELLESASLGGVSELDKNS